MDRITSLWLELALFATLFGGGGGIASASSIMDHPLVLPAQPTLPTPTYDPLATPLLPENPSQVDIGHHLYYYNCMPCHGDRGQGLTDAWRQEWEEDHQNCWGRGCHAGRAGDEGFPIPRLVPAVIQEGGVLERYADPEALYAYLKVTHPPQEPGRLAENEYRALVAYLWAVNGRAAPELPSETDLASTTAVTQIPRSSGTAVQLATLSPTDTPQPAASGGISSPAESAGNRGTALLGGMAIALVLALLGAAVLARRRE